MSLPSASFLHLWSGTFCKEWYGAIGGRIQTYSGIQGCDEGFLGTHPSSDYTAPHLHPCMAGNCGGEWARTLEPPSLSRSRHFVVVRGPMRSPRPSGADRLLRVCLPPLWELQRHNEMVTTVALCFWHCVCRATLEAPGTEW